jgi:hypothetical protein
MFEYGIKFVYAGWMPNETDIGFSYQGRRAWEKTVGAGTRMLIYEDEGSGDRFSSSIGKMAIIGEVEVTGAFYQDELKTLSPEHSHLLPVVLVRTAPPLERINLSEIRKVLG